MPDLTTASAIPLMRSSLTLQANLFQEFHPIGGVSARFADGAGFSWAKRVALNSKVAAIPARIKWRIFMHTFYQKYLAIGKRKRRGPHNHYAACCDPLQCPLTILDGICAARRSIHA